MTLIVCFWAALLCLPSAALALPLLSEVYYDAMGSDNGLVFVELYGAPGEDLSGYVIEGINGADGGGTVSFALAGTIPASGFFVVGDDAGDGTSLVTPVDLVRNFDFQNGPDSVLLWLGEQLIDALGYGVFGSGDVFAGEGAPAPDAPAGSSLERLFADVDSQDNAADFAVLTLPTPGSAPLLGVAEPSAPLLMVAALGLVGLQRATATRAA